MPLTNTNFGSGNTELIAAISVFEQSIIKIDVNTKGTVSLLMLMMMMKLLSCRAFTQSKRHDTFGGHLEYKFLQPPAKPTRYLTFPTTCFTLVASGRICKNAFTMIRRPCIEGKPRGKTSITSPVLFHDEQPQVVVPMMVKILV